MIEQKARYRLERAGARLDRLALYPRRVRIDRVRVVTLPLFFRLPFFRRFDGFALTKWTILLRRPLDETSDDLLCHELCHVWQMQHHPLRVLLAFFLTRRDENPYEAEARRAVSATRETTV